MNLFVHAICTNKVVTASIAVLISQERLKRTLNLNILTESNSLSIQATVAEEFKCNWAAFS